MSVPVGFFVFVAVALLTSRRVTTIDTLTIYIHCYILLIILFAAAFLRVEASGNATGLRAAFVFDAAAVVTPSLRHIYQDTETNDLTHPTTLLVVPRPPSHSHLLSPLSPITSPLRHPDIFDTIVNSNVNPHPWQVAGTSRAR
jgi:hypothetical protein